MRSMLMWVLFAGAGFACLNDTATVRAEDEFRSRYGETTSDEQSAGATPLWAQAVVAVSSAILALSARHVWRRQRGRNPAADA